MTLVVLVLLLGGGSLTGRSVPSQEVPPKPLQLYAKAEYEGAVSIAALAWREDAENELGFEVLRSQGDEEFKVVGITGANTTRYRDKIGRYISGAFRYQVRAFNESGRGEPSDPVSVWF